jgi:hypothetical protein
MTVWSDLEKIGQELRHALYVVEEAVLVETSICVGEDRPRETVMAAVDDHLAAIVGVVFMLRVGPDFLYYPYALEPGQLEDSTVIDIIPRVGGAVVSNDIVRFLLVREDSLGFTVGASSTLELSVVP